METVRIRIFGTPGVAFGSGGWFRQPTRAADLLLGYLSLHGERLHPREKLAELLWRDADPELARNALRTTLWRLRSRLEPAGVARGAVIRVDPAGDVGLNWDTGLWCDVSAFRSAMPRSAMSLRMTPNAADLARLQEAVDLYRGNLMDSFYDEWVVAERAALQEAWLQALDILMLAAERAKDWDTALDYGRRILADDPLLETIHRRMILVYMQRGDRARALKQYNICAQQLRAELAIEPMPETRALRHRILTGTLNPDDLSNQLAQDLHSAVLRVEDALRSLEAARACYIAGAGQKVARTRPLP
jgi:DNA-binding SARP family transcriptional activator